LNTASRCGCNSLYTNGYFSISPLLTLYKEGKTVKNNNPQRKNRSKITGKFCEI
jgi:hypothetical protein